MSFISWVEKIFGQGGNSTTVAQSAEQAYQNLLKEEQDAAAWISGSIAIINQNITIDSTLVAPIIKSVFPNVDPNVIEQTLVKLAATVTQVQSSIPTTLEGAIAVIQAYLQPKQGNFWVTEVQGLVNLGATLVSPSTPIQKFVAVGEFVYQDIVTPLLGLHKASSAPVGPVPTPAPAQPMATQPVVTPNQANTVTTN